MPTVRADGSLDRHASSSAPGSDGAALGALLRGARERRGLTLQEISNQTRIPRRHLDAIEQGNLSAIPGGFYRRAQVRAYADVVQVDRNLALARLEHALAEPPAGKTAPPRQRTAFRASFSRHASMAIGLIAIAAVLVAFAQWAADPTAKDLSTHTAGSSPQPSAAVASPTPTTLSLPVESSNPAPLDQAVPVDQSVPPPSIVGTDREPDGELVVTTEPAGGRVTVNGIGWGTTPLTIRHLPIGTARVRVTKDGYAVEERVVGLTAERPTATLQIELRSGAASDE